MHICEQWEIYMSQFCTVSKWNRTIASNAKQSSLWISQFAPVTNRKPSTKAHLLTWIKFNSIMDKYLRMSCSMGSKILTTQKLQRLNFWSFGVNTLFRPTHFWLCGHQSTTGISLIRVMPRSHVMLPPYGRRTVLRSVIGKMWFSKIVWSCGQL